MNDTEMIDMCLKAGIPFFYNKDNNELQHFYPPLPWTGPNHNPNLFKVILKAVADGKASWVRDTFFKGHEALMIKGKKYDLMESPSEESKLTDEDKEIIATFQSFM